MSSYEYYEDAEIESLITNNNENAISFLIKKFQKKMPSLEMRENEFMRAEETHFVFV